MAPIWKMVALTMLVTVGGGFFWHFSEMKDLRYANNTRNDAVREEVKLLTAYNEVLKAEGLPAANGSLGTKEDIKKYQLSNQGYDINLDQDKDYKKIEIRMVEMIFNLSIF